MSTPGTPHGWSRRIALLVEYDGTDFAGSQAQPDRRTVQGVLEAAVVEFTGEAQRVAFAGRTDAGVHALGQVCHFDAPRSLTLQRWQRAFDRLLPEDIRVVSCEAADGDFHARFSARQKTYRYHVDLSPVASPFLSPFSWHRPLVRDIDSMRDAASRLLGPINQRVFAAQPQGDHDIRTIDRFDVDVGRLLTFTVQSRAFMRHAVRGMVGSLLEVGCGRRTVDEIEAMAKDAAGHPPMVKAPPQGLFLVRVDY